MNRLSDADGATPNENGPRIGDEKQPLNNGIADRAYPIMASVEKTDQMDTSVNVQRFIGEKPPLPVYHKIPKRKYRTYDDTGIRNRKPVHVPPAPTSRFWVERVIRRKTGLTRCGFILAVLCVLLIIVLFVMYIILWLMKSPCSKKICVKPSCLRSSAEMLPKIDLNEEPCINFRGFACGGWFSTKPLPNYQIEWDLKAIMLRNYRQEVLGLVNRSPSRPHTISAKMNTFYESCINGVRSGRERTREIRDYIIDRLSTGEWVVFENTVSNSWNVYEFVGNMLSEMNASPFFQIEIISDPRNVSHNVIYLKPPTLILADPNLHVSRGHDKKYNETVRLLTKYIKDVFHYMDVTTFDAKVYGHRIVEYEKSLASFVVSGRINKTQPCYSRMKVRNLDEEFYPIEFYRMLPKIFPALSLEDSVLVENVGYFKELSKFINKAVINKSDDLNAFTIWRIVADYVPYFSSELEETHRMFEAEMTDEHERMPRWEYCTSLMHKYASQYLLPLHEKQTSTTEKQEIHTIVSQIFSDTLSVIRQNLKQIGFTKEQANFDRLSQAKIQIGLPPEMLQDDYVKEYFDRYTTVANDLKENILISERFRNKHFKKKLFQPKNADRFLDNMISMPTAITYNPASNYIVVPWPVLQRPYFEKDYPITSLYGSIGVEIAKALIRSLFPSPTEEYISRLSQKVLGKDFSTSNFTDTEEYVVTLAALKFSYESLKNRLSSIEDIYLPGMETFKNEEVFFISYVQSICTVRTDKLAIGEQLSNNVNDFLIATSGMLELPEFTALYGCHS